ncbi:Disks large 1 tumor suppressor protein [Pseudolycoriella hygida]|uniref:Disks large 1 tumor suppressor protein n=1 Tax=Pseudolycoriella hygida TaxID=35572 RepID=A0A9Q0MYU0_9DIPT|nr:Disks large 1 tumor suppressor protein [Pseudolycoriella hygida]
MHSNSSDYIQEFYELTLLDDTKTIQQKTVETLQIASKWEQENSLKISDSDRGTALLPLTQALINLKEQQEIAEINQVC